MLEDHVDLGAYVAYLEGIAKRLGGLGKPVDDEDRLYHLLRGLPDDYRIAKQAIKMPQNKDPGRRSSSSSRTSPKTLK